jgi:3,4-dihydroxy 2-butanone 4-phosphate synthase / GTP cyclohydrolase II
MNLRSRFCTVTDAFSELRLGRMFILIDGNNQYSEAHLATATDTVSRDTLHSMVKLSGGIMCWAQPQTDSGRIKLPEKIQKMFSRGASFPPKQLRDPHSDGSCNMRTGKHEGTLGDKRHPLVPLCTHKCGILSRPGQAEAIVDLARLAGLNASGFLCKMFGVDGHPLRSVSLLTTIAQSHELRILEVTDLIRYRLSREVHIKPMLDVQMEMRRRDFKLISVASGILGRCWVIVKGDAETFKLNAPIVRIEPMPCIEDGSMPQNIYQRASVNAALKLMRYEKRGIVICCPTPVPADNEERFLVESLTFFREDPFLTLWASCQRRLISAGICAQVLHHLHADRIRVMTDEPRRLADLKLFGIDIVGAVALHATTQPVSKIVRYRYFGP